MRLFFYLILLFVLIEINAFLVAPRILANCKKSGNALPVFVVYYLYFQSSQDLDFK